MTTSKQVSSDQETLVEQINTYIYGIQQSLEELCVLTKDDATVLRKARELVETKHKKTKQVLSNTVKRVYADTLSEKLRLRRHIQALKGAIKIIEEHHALVRPNQFHLRKAILEVMDTSDTPVSAKQIIEYLSLCGLLIDRRRLSIRLSTMKRTGVVKNPKHARWTITAAGRKELRYRQQD